MGWIEIQIKEAPKDKMMETPPRSARIPLWLYVICEDIIKVVEADDFSDYIRGVILKHAVSLDIPIPDETQDEWPEWVLKPRKEIPPKEIRREIKGF